MKTVPVETNVLESKIVVLQKRIGDVNEKFNELAGRLGYVMSVLEPATALCEPECPAESDSQAVEKIVAESDRLSYLSEDIQDVIDRLQV